MSRVRQLRHVASSCLLVTILVLAGAGVSGSPRTTALARSLYRAPVITPRAALVRVLTAPQVEAAWFNPLFLLQVSAAQVQQGVDSLKATFGPFVSVAPAAGPDGSYTVAFQRGTVQGRINLDNQGRIIGLAFTNARFTYVSRAAALRGLGALPGRVSLLVLANGATRLAVAPDQALAVGSAFKLAVLAALRGQIAAHRLSWTQQVTLLAQDKSLPSGVLQTKPVGSRYGVADVARYMISISDNTAANMLIRLVGRAAIDPLLPPPDRPILTTREFFVLKDPANRALRERYLAAATPAQRLAILAQADKLPLPALRPFAALLAKGPVAPRVEWFLSARQLCALMGRVADLPQMSVNPGVADPAEWARVAYKGGSETGALNLTTQVTAHDGTTYCVAATWNNAAPLDEGRFERLYASLLHSLR